MDSIAPRILILSPEKRTYNNTNLSLEWITYEETSISWYQLVNQANITVTGNTTLTGLSDGSHCIVVYANDSAGNMGKSETISFTVNTQSSPSPSVAPSNSATSQQTFAPASNPEPTTDNTMSWISFTIIAIVIVSVGSIVYILKRRRDRQQ